MRARRPLAGSRDLVGADRLFQRAEVMAVVEDPHLNPVPFLSVNLPAFPANVIGHPGGGHEIPFVGRVDEHASGKTPATQHRDLPDEAVLQANAFLPVQPLVPEDRHLGFTDVVLEHLFGHARFEDPHGALVPVDGRSPLALVPVFFRVLPFPGFRFLIFLPNAMIEIPGKAADDRLVPGIGPTQTAAGKAAKMAVGPHEDCGFAHPPGLHGGDDSGGCSAVNHHVIGFGGGGAAGWHQEDQAEERGEPTAFHGIGRTASQKSRVRTTPDGGILPPSGVKRPGPPNRPEWLGPGRTCRHTSHDRFAPRIRGSFW